MALPRLQLHQLLREALGSDYVYFQPPANVKLHFPAIIYRRERIDRINADNQFYGHEVGYSVTVVDPNPDSEIVDRVSQLPKCQFSRHYVSDNLNHDVFIIYN